MTSFSAEERAMLEARTRALAAAPGEGPIERSVDVLLLHVAGSRFGLALKSVGAVADLARLTPIPHAPPHVAGLMTHLGEVLVVFYLRRALGLGLAALPEFGRVVIVGRGAERLALVVDAIEGPLPLRAADLRPPPAAISSARHGLVKSVDPSGLAILDEAALTHMDLFFVDIPLP